MRKVLYITNIEVPYRVKFFNKLSKYTDLTVLYERDGSSNRNSEWAKSVDASFTKKFLGGRKISNENSFSLGIIKYLKGNYDDIIISCFNSPVQIIGMLYLRLTRKKYILSFDGEQFIGDKGLKNAIKRFIICGADKYLVAGDIAAENIKKLVRNKKVYSYNFSSYTAEELEENKKNPSARRKEVLVVGQYFDYKGLDIAVKIARFDPSINYRFVGMGSRTEQFVNDLQLSNDANIEVVPFLQKQALNKEYRESGLLLLPSRKECWGLVINEAASFGLPIVATNGSGAAKEFLRGKYSRYLFDSNDIKGMHDVISELLSQDNKEYSDYLIETSSKYSVENMVDAHLKVLKEL